jgi:serine/threonine protein kinase
MATNRPAALAIGELLDGKYQITRELGRGAMGVVYEALHMALGRRVAIKTLLQEVLADPQLGARFEREARAASAIGHPHIVDVFDLGRTSDGLLYMVMELLDGEPLVSILQKTPRLPIPLAVHLMVQVLSGLSAAHKNGIVHRDLKPDNIFVINSDDRLNFVKIVDFGISKVMQPQGSSPAATAKVAGTMVGAILGTPLYMSPEQAIGQVSLIDHHTDIYSAGVVLYEMLCGRTPFVGEGYAQILCGLLDGKYPPPRSLRPDIPAALEAAIVRALDRDIAKRFANAVAMREAISGGDGDATPAPLLTSASIGDPLRVSPSSSDHRGDGLASIGLLEVAPPSKPASGKARRALPGEDPFAPPPDRAMSPLLADDTDRPLTARSPVAQPLTPARFDPPPLELDAPPRPHTVAQDKGTLAPQPVFSRRTRSRLVKAGILLSLLAGARVVYSILRPGGDGGLLARRGGATRFFLTVEPADASVQIDHIPVAKGELALESGVAHVLNAAAPGRVTRRFSFAAKTGLKLSVRLGHILPLPSPTDPEPLSAELAAGYPDDARPAAEIDRAFAKLDHFTECLALIADANGEAKKGSRARLRGDELAQCQGLVREAAATEPAMAELQAAAETYLAAIQAGQKIESVARMAATFRGEFLVARTAWQMEEVSQEGTSDGQGAAWHMRRLALAGQSWFRGLKAPGGLGIDQRRAKLDEYHQAFLDYAGRNQPEIARIAGASDFMRAARALAALGGGQAAIRRPSELAALDACRQLLTAFNALVVE